jgi:acetyltransferase-like isoleucine patch superfamily enzyme
MINKIIKKLDRLLHECIMNRTFNKYGHGAYMMKPHMLTNPQHIIIEENVFIRGYSRIEAITSDGYTQFNPKIRIGKGTHIEQYFHVGACELVDIGENVLIASRVYISDHNHRFSNINLPIKQQGVEAGGKVIIENNAWLGEGCAVLPGVTIGKNSIIGTNSVVTRDIPAYSIAVGIPAKVIKQYDFTIAKWVPVKLINRETGN